jgi:hypothetical protein
MSISHIATKIWALRDGDSLLLIFLLFAWYIGSAGYRQHLSALKAIGEPGVRLRKMVLEMRTAFTGWLALSLVAVGLVDKHGLTHLGVVFHACHG